MSISAEIWLARSFQLGVIWWFKRKSDAKEQKYYWEGRYCGQIQVWEYEESKKGCCWLELNEQWHRNGSLTSIWKANYRPHRDFQFYFKSDGKPQKILSKNVGITSLKDNCRFYREINFRSTKEDTGQTENYFRSLREIIMAWSLCDSSGDEEQ